MGVILSYFRKLFNCGSQFGLSPGNVNNLRFVCIIRRLNIKGAGSDRFRGGESVESFRKKGKFGERIGMEKQRLWGGRGSAEQKEKDGAGGGA